MKELKGFLKNKSHLGGHIMKRYVAPHGLIPLEELYAQYGTKYALAKDDSFITWLQEVKLRDKERWVIVDDDKDEFTAVNEEMRAEKEEAEEKLDKRPADLQVMELTDLSVRKAREALPMISDARVLKYALKEASQLPNKDSLCVMIRKRISELSSQGIT